MSAKFLLVIRSDHPLTDLYRHLADRIEEGNHLTLYCETLEMGGRYVTATPQSQPEKILLYVPHEAVLLASEALTGAGHPLGFLPATSAPR